MASRIQRRMGRQDQGSHSSEFASCQLGEGTPPQALGPAKSWCQKLQQLQKLREKKWQRERMG